MRALYSFILSCLIAICATGYAEDSRLVVTGEAILRKPADQLLISAGVISQDKEAQKALQGNSRQVEAILQVLQKAGLQSKEYATGHFEIRPVYSIQPPKASPDWKQSIVGYEVSNMIEIHTDKLSIAGQLIDALNQAGANNIQVNFGLKDPLQYRAEAIRTASARAQEDAATLVQSTNVKLGNLVEITLDHHSSTPIFPKSNRFSYTAMESSGQDVPLVPGEIEVRSTVQLTYAILP